MQSLRGCFLGGEIMIKIVHLSDLHFKIDGDYFVDPLLNLLESELIEIEKMIIVVTGDIVNSGSKEEYEKAENIIFKPIKNLRGSKKIEFVLTPGNHDVDYSEFPNDGENYYNNIIGEDVSFNKMKNFCYFHKSILGKSFRTGNYTNDVVIKTSKFDIKFYPVDSTVYSSKKEKRGELYLFKDGLANVKSNINTLNIAVTHHPYDYYNEEANKFLKEYMGSGFDFVFMGHKHYTNGIELYSNMNRHNRFEFLGGKLFEKDDNIRLTIITIDDDYKMYVKDYINEKNIYISKERVLQMENIETIIKKDSIYNLNETFERITKETILDFEALDGNVITLDKLFVHPTLFRKIDNSIEITKVDEVDELKFIENENYIISAPSEFGKTTLIRKYFFDYLKMNYVPVLISVEEEKEIANINAFKKMIKKALDYNYDSVTLDNYNNINRKKRILLLDDFDNLKLPRNMKEKLIEYCSEYFSQIIITVNYNYDLRSAFTTYANYEKINWKFYEIKEYSYAKIEELLVIWHSYDNIIFTDKEFAVAIEESTQILHRIINTAHIPRVAFYLLIALKYSASLDTGDSSRPHYYRKLIMNSEEKLKTEKDDEKTAISKFLRVFAKVLFDSGNMYMTELAFRNFHIKYMKKLKLNVDNGLIFEFDKLVKNLKRAGLFVQLEQNIKFKHKYQYFYFISLYLFKNLIKEQDTVYNLVNNINKSNALNIVNFLLYHDESQYIAEILIKKSKSVLIEEPKFNYVIDIEEINSLSKIPVHLQRLKETEPILERRMKRAKKTDERLRYESTRISEKSEDGVVLDEVLEGLKIIELFGQSFKLHWGNIDGDIKLEMYKESHRLLRRIQKKIKNEIYLKHSDFKEKMYPLMHDILIEKSNSKQSISEEIIDEFIDVSSNQILYHIHWFIQWMLLNNAIKIIYSPRISEIVNEVVFDDHEYEKIVNYLYSLQKYQQVNIKELRKLVDYYKNNKAVIQILYSSIFELNDTIGVNKLMEVNDVFGYNRSANMSIVFEK